MATLSEVLKNEIYRLAKKATREPLTSLQAASAKQRKQIAALSRELAALKKDLAQLQRSGKQKAPIAKAEKSGKANVRFQSRGLKSLRTRLALSAEEFGSLVGVSGQTIYNWEAGKSVPNSESLEKLADLRGIGKREAAARLAKS